MQRIFVGDVQGCGDELGSLIERAEREFGDAFELWLVGDLINRGPKNPKTLELVWRLWERRRARPVLGNHELSLLRLAYGLRDAKPDDTFQDLLEGPNTDRWLEWIRHWPLCERGCLGERPFAMIHAASAPRWSLEKLEKRARRLEERLRDSEKEARRLLSARPDEDRDADDLERLTRCRSADAKGHWSSREPDRPGGAWHRAWSKQGHDFALVYGHWALQGLHLDPSLRGLDTGCVYNGNGRKGVLTAWVPDESAADPFALPDSRFWEIPARGRYWRPVS